MTITSEDQSTPNSFLLEYVKKPYTLGIDADRFAE